MRALGPPTSSSSVPILHRFPTVTQLVQRLNPWVFLVGLILALAGSSFSVNFVIQGSVGSGSYTYIVLGPVLVFVGVILMAVCYATRRS